MQREKPSNCAASTEKIYIRKDLRSPLIATPTFVAEKDGARSVRVNSLRGPGADVGGTGVPRGGLTAPPVGLGHPVGAAAVTPLDRPVEGGLRRESELPVSGTRITCCSSGIIHAGKRLFQESGSGLLQ